MLVFAIVLAACDIRSENRYDENQNPVRLVVPYTALGIPYVWQRTGGTLSHQSMTMSEQNVLE